jgi:3'-phosphoadenosine 5'-phosphosulfate (PAPS) 3'-phosphatase
LQVVVGNIDLYAYPKAGAKRWDICSGQAIIEALGGKLTDMKGNNYKYTKVKSEYPCTKGMLSALRMKPYEKSLVSIKELI